MTDRPAAELLPCPFCGAGAEMTGLGYHGPADCYDVLVRCTGCEAQGPASIVDASEGEDEGQAADAASAAWNRRPAYD